MRRGDGARPEDGLPRSDDDLRARLALQRAGIVETLRALADDVAALPDDRLGAVLPRLHRPLGALRAALNQPPTRRRRT
jgi:hypothetical protein